ncbi:MAG TPA: MBL fold metallo-hydrolase [Streptosporangiaceae bacterium]|nr:MBL fold metallo-hydrolase [Streptosporangiaceae bacterium]
MRLTVLGACGAWPEPQQACSGFLVEHDGFRLILDLGYATVPRLLSLVNADQIDAVVISHGHPDHCADLNPLLRARALSDDPPPPLPVYAPPGALDAVLALDRPETLDGSYQVHDVAPGTSLSIGPFGVDTRLLPHWLPNLGVRLTADGRVLAYTGDTGPSDEVVELARDADLLLAEATHLDPVPRDARPYMSSPRVAGRQAEAAGAARVLLTHLWPGADRAAVLAQASAEYSGDLGIAVPDLSVDLH